MQKNKRPALKIAGFLASALLLASALTVGMFAASFSDTQSHWSNTYVEYMVEKEILSGYTDGTFKPDNTVTRAEFIKMVDATFGLTATTSISYNDVSESDWYYVYIQRAAEQGYILDYGKDVNPNGQLTREEAAALLVRYLDVPESVMAKESAFTDYSSISSQYRTYVLKAAGAGLIKGYEDNTFRPQNTLTRAEAMTILYRAAGTIYKTSTNGADSGANSVNAVITSSDTIISGAKISGNIYITEGATNGTVTFINCTFADDVYLRGTVKVVFQNCSVGTLNVSSLDGYTPSVQLENGSQITTVKLNTAADITLSSGTKIGTLNVEASAPKSSVDGKGTIDAANINASRFVSDIIPAKYEIAKDITATFGDKVYSGSQADTDGFTKTPSLTSTSNSDTIVYTPAQVGYLWYYYTNEATAPTNLSFATYHTKASLKSKLPLSSVKEYSSTLATYNDASSYKYIVAALADASGNFYKPVVLTRSAASGTYSANGLSAKPYITIGTNYDTLSCTPVVSGTLYYYYTNVSTAPSASYYMNYYSAAVHTTYNVQLYGSVTVSANTAVNAATINNVYATGYNYVVIMLTTGNMSYEPLVISRSDSTSSGVTGFSDTPTVTLSTSSYDIFSVKPSYNGTIYYYYTNSSTTPTAQNYLSYYGINSAYCGIQNVVATSYAQTITSSVLSANATSVGYNYVVFMLVDNSGTRYTPVTVSRGASSTASGFSTAPTLTTSGNYDTLNFTTSSTGAVFYFYSATNTDYTSVNFATAYQNATTTKSGFNVSAGNPISTSTAITTSVSGYNYMVVCFRDSNGTYSKPVTITRNGSASSSGFNVTPTLSTNANYDYLSFTPSYSGTVYYFYSAYNTTYTYLNFETAYNSASTTKSYTTVYAGNAVNTPIALYQNVSAYNYLVVCYRNSSGTYSAPVTITRGGTSTAGTGFTIAPTVVTGTTGYNYLSGTPSYSGTLQYFYTTYNSTYTSSTFVSTYNSTSALLCGYLTTVANSAINNQAIGSISSTSYPYVVVCLKDKYGTYYTPVTIRLNATSTSTSGTGFYGTPTSTVSYTNDVITFTPTIAGTFYYYYSTTNTVPTNCYSQFLNATYKGSATVSYVNYQLSVKAQNTSNVTAYPYIVVFMQYNSVYYTPVVITRSGSSSSTTGFTGTPSVSTISNTDYLQFTVAAAGTIQLYYTNSNVTPSSTEFPSSMLNSPVSSQYYMTTAGTGNISITSTINVSGYAYVVVMYTDTTGRTYSPILLTR